MPGIKDFYLYFHVSVVPTKIVESEHLDMVIAATIPQPRTYTPAFAEAIRDLLPGLKGGNGKPDVSLETKSAQEIFNELPWTTWDEAELGRVCHYLRGNRHLKIPQSWVDVFPRPLETLFKLEQRQSARAF